MSTGTHGRAIRGYAARFYADTVGQDRLLEPTDANLAAILSGCIVPPASDSFDRIRRRLAKRYDVRLTVDRIFDHAEAIFEIQVDISATFATRTTSELADDYRAALRRGGDHAGKVQTWITDALRSRLGAPAAASARSSTPTS